jgi:hypothetical protein
MLCCTVRCTPYGTCNTIPDSVNTNYSILLHSAVHIDLIEVLDAGMLL